jgi:tetratricopeptide (TPR) repeat protein
VRQGEQTLEALIAATRKGWEAAPDVPQKLGAYVDALVKAERKPHEDEAIRVLLKTYERPRNYNFKVRADDILLRQLSREARAVRAKAQQTGSEDDKQQARLAALDQRQHALEIYRERVNQYPTDLRMKFRLGSVLFEAGEYDEAIPVLQLAQGEPRSRAQAQLLIGRAFMEKGNPAQAAEVLRESLEKIEVVDDHAKDLMYWLARAYESAGNREEAKGVLGRLLRHDYNYHEGDARKRMDELNKTTA